MGRYVVSDIHNNWDRFKQLLDIIKFSKKDKLVINGDLIDRGVTTKPFIKFLKEHKEQVIFIIGNHEQMFIEAYETGKLFDKLIEIETNSIFYGGANKSIKRMVHEDEVCNLWIYNGGNTTLETLDKEEIEWFYKYLKEDCSYYKFIDDNLFVHAGPHLYDRDYTREDIEKWLAKEDIRNLIWDRNFFTKYCVLKRTVGIKVPCNIFVGHNSMVGHKLNFKAVTETKMDNKYKIVATDMSDISGDDSSMMLYHIETSEVYVASKGNINKYEYLDAKGYHELYKVEHIGRYIYLTRDDKKMFAKYNKKNEPITQEQYHDRFILGKEKVEDFI